VGYITEIVRGVSWLGGLKAVSRLVAFVKTGILARVLVPAQFGLFGIASLVLELLEILTETGINVVLMQEKRGLNSYINTAWIVSIIRGFLIATVLLIASPLIVRFFNSPETYRLLFLMALVPVIRGFINPAEVKFVKELMFKKEFIFRFSIFIFDSAVAISLALFTHSAASLIYGLIAGAVLEVILSFILIKPIPRVVFERKKFSEVVNRGKWLTGAGIFNYFFTHGDDIVVGKLLGTYPLGIYQVAYRISTLPITEISDVVGKVTFPVYVRISEDKKRLTSAFLKSLTGVCLIVIPFATALFLFPRQIILLVLGANWIEAVGVLKILAIFGGVKAISNTVFALLLSLGKQKYVTLITFVGILGLGASIIPLVKAFGITGAAISALIGAILAIPVAIYAVRKAIGEIK